jgi:hypothetical protein
MFFTGWQGIAVSMVIFSLMWAIVSRGTRGNSFVFERTPNDFEKLLIVFLDIATFILTLAGGGIVLVISSTALGSAKKLPPNYASPLFLLVMSMFYGILFMPLLALSYEAYKHDGDSYTRVAYIRNQTLAFSALACFCLGYGWLIVAAVRG